MASPSVYDPDVNTRTESPDTRETDSTFRLALSALIATVVLILVGGFTRGSGSGYGCQDRWPLCEDGLLGGWLPRAEFHMIVEWSHRWVAAAVGLLALLTAVSAWRRHREDRLTVGIAVGAVLAIVVQSLIGRAVVKQDLDADLVSLHLAISLTVALLLVLVVVRLGVARPDPHVSARGWVGALMVGSAGVFLVIMLGSLVHNLYFPGWPLMLDTWIPDLTSRTATIHFLHRLASGLYLVAAWLLWSASRSRNRPELEKRLLWIAALLYTVNVAIGATHVFTEVTSAALVALHLGLASSVFLLTAAATASAERTGAIPQPSGLVNSQPGV